MEFSLKNIEELIKAALPFSEIEECGMGVVPDKTYNEHNKQCEECRCILRLRDALDPFFN